MPNHQNALVAGSIVLVTLQVHAPPYLHVPAAAVFSRGTKNCIAVITPENRIAVHEVHVMENDGEIVHFTSDVVRAGDRVALDVGNSVPDGQRVQPVTEGSAQPAS